MKYLFSSLPLADMAHRHPITYFDISSRGGFQDDLHPLAFGVDAVGFEPDPEEFRHLQTLPPGPWKSVMLLPHGISAQSGPQTLHVPADPQSASLLKHDQAIGKKFNKPQFFEIQRQIEIQTLSLSDALGETDFSSVDYLKIGIEGAELPVFRLAPELMKTALALKTEMSFIPIRTDQPLASEVDQFLGGGGFELMDIAGPAHWRRHGYLIHPYYSPETPPYSKGQIVQADFLYLRDADSLSEDLPRLLKLALIAMSLGYFDHALMALERPAVADHLAREYKKTPLEMVAPASKLYGRKMFIRAVHRQVRDLIPFLRYSKNLVR